MRLLGKSGETVLDCEVRIALSEVEFRFLVFAAAALALQLVEEGRPDAEVDRGRKLSKELSSIRLRETLQ